jgi:putative addiction module killer protein
MKELRIYKSEQDREPFTDWLEGLKDRQARAILRARLARVQLGNLGDCKALRKGVMELRIDHGPGYRVYLSQQGEVLVLLLCGGDKRSQDADIERAIEYLEDWKEKGKP